MNLLALMPKLSPECIRRIAIMKDIPIGSVPLVKLEDALAALGYSSVELNNWKLYNEKTHRKKHCNCHLCRIGGEFLVNAWMELNDKSRNDSGSI